MDVETFEKVLELAEKYDDQGLEHLANQGEFFEVCNGDKLEVFDPRLFQSNSRLEYLKQLQLPDRNIWTGRLYSDEDVYNLDGRMVSLGELVSSTEADAVVTEGHDRMLRLIARVTPVVSMKYRGLETGKQPPQLEAPEED